MADECKSFMRDSDERVRVAMQEMRLRRDQFSEGFDTLSIT